MKVIIAGSRTIWHYEVVETAMKDSGFDITEVVSGHAHGVDRIGEDIAKEWKIPIKLFPADWSRGRHAGLVRNQQMAEYADALVAVWDGYSRGTQHMITTMNTMQKPVFIGY